MILLRPWCAGEITTAHGRQVSTLCVVLPEFPHTSDDFIDHYDEHVQKGQLRDARKLPIVNEDFFRNW